jgi:hypothetical protein
MDVLDEACPAAWDPLVEPPGVALFDGLAPREVDGCAGNGPDCGMVGGTGAVEPLPLDRGAGCADAPGGGTRSAG